MTQKIEKILSRKIIVFSIIAIVALIIYSNSFNAPFTLDDFGSIANNTEIRNPFNLFAIWKFYSSRFIIYFTFSINYLIHQNNVVGYHIVNVLIHIANGILVYIILHTILGFKHFRGKILQKYQNIICLLAALVFITHPVQVNAVTYVVQRTAALAATFYLLSILFYIKYRLNDKIRNFLFTLLFIVLAMFTKENTITIPFMLALIEFMFFLKDGKTTWKKRILILFIIFLTLPIVPSTNLFLGGYSQSDPNNQFMASTNMDRFQYFYTEMNVIVRYIKNLFIPDHLNFDYSNDFPVSKTIWSNHSYISFAFLLFMGIVALFNWKRNKLIAFGILWFYIGLAVESSFISIKDVYFEHRLYFPVVGFIIFLIGCIFDEVPWKKRLYAMKKPLAYFIVSFSFLIIMYSCATLYRNYLFNDLSRLWSDVVQKAPLSDRAHCVLATSYLNKYEANNVVNAEYLNMSEMEFVKSLKLNYLNDISHCNLSKVYLLKKEYQKCINEAYRVHNSKYAYYNTGGAYEGLENNDMAIQSYLSGLKIDKQCVFILKALGSLYEKMRDYQNCKYYYNEFLKYNTYPDSKTIKTKLIEVDELIELSR